MKCRAAASRREVNEPEGCLPAILLLMDQSCGFCGRAAVDLSLCSCCREALYCSRRCQQRHSTTHQTMQRTMPPAPFPSLLLMRRFTRDKSADMDIVSEVELWRSTLRLAGIMLPPFDYSCRQNDVHDIWVESLRPGDFADAWLNGAWQDAYLSDGDMGRLELRATQGGGVSRWHDRLVVDTTCIRPSATRRAVWRCLIKSNDIVEYHGFGRWRWAHVVRVDGERINLETSGCSLWTHRSDPHCSALIITRV